MDLLKRLVMSILIIIGGVFLSFIIIDMLSLSSEVSGFLFVLCFIALVVCEIKRLRRPPKVDRVGKSTNKWQGWQKVDKNKYSDDASRNSDRSVQPSRNESFDRKPWHERNDIIWQGKRKAQIQYKDRDGNMTERDITMIGILPNQYGELTLRAKCHLRDDWRTFYIDRIDSIKTARNKVYDDFSDYMSNELKI